MLQLSNIVRYAPDTRNVQPFSLAKNTAISPCCCVRSIGFIFHLNSCIVHSIIRFLEENVSLLEPLVHSEWHFNERKTEQLISTDGLVKMLMKCVCEWCDMKGGREKRWMHCMDAGSPSSLLIWTCELSNQNGLQICYEAVEFRSMAKIISLHSSSWFLFAHGKKSTQFVWYTKPTHTLTHTPPTTTNFELRHSIC